MTLSAVKLSEIHAACFTVTRPWRAQEFEDLLGRQGAILLGDARGFVLARQVADEAEILTIAVLPAARRLGIASGLLAELASKLRENQVVKAHLEVSADNDPALALYYGAGYRETGRRSGYYAGAGAIAQDALILSKTLI